MNKKELLDYFRQNRSKVNIYRCTGPAEHWITTYVKGVWGFNREKRNHDFWKNLREGDLIIFHASRSTISSSNPVGIIGFGIVGKTYVKDGMFWYTEYKNQENIWPYIVTFSDIFFLGEMKKIDNTRFINEKSDEETMDEIDNITKNRISFDEIKENVVVDGSPYNFPKQGSSSTIKKECEDLLLERFEALETFQTKNEDLEILPDEYKEDIKQDYEVSKELDLVSESEKEKYIEKRIKEISEETVPTDPKERFIVYKQRFTRLKSLLKKKFKNRCQCCDFTFLQKNAQYYSEVCHIIQWTKSHDDSQENLLVLCPNHHKQFDLGDKKIREKILNKIKEKFPDIDYKEI